MSLEFFLNAMGIFAILIPMRGNETRGLLKPSGKLKRY